MKPAVILAGLIIIIAGCVQNSQPGTQYLLNEQDLAQLGMTDDVSESELQAFGLNGTNCRIEEQYSICIYNIPGLNNTQVIVELKKFTNFEDLNGTYQYNSLHMFSSQGLISQNTLGDQSRFRVNNENDYGGNLTPPGVYYYHLWITKSLHLIHVTSSGSNKDAGEHVTRIGQMMLSKLEFKRA